MVVYIRLVILLIDGEVLTMVQWRVVCLVRLSRLCWI